MAGTAIRGVRLGLAILHLVAAACSIILVGLAGNMLAIINNARNIQRAAQQQALVQWGLAPGGRKLLQFVVINKGNDAVALIMFVALSGAIWNVFFALNHLVPALHRCCLGALAAKSARWARSTFFEMIIAGVWWVLWMAGAGTFTNLVPVSMNDYINAFLALTWICWVLWMAVVALTAAEYGLSMVRRSAPADPRRALPGDKVAPDHKAPHTTKKTRPPGSRASTGATSPAAATDAGTTAVHVADTAAPVRVSRPHGTPATAGQLAETCPPAVVLPGDAVGIDVPPATAVVPEGPARPAQAKTRPTDIESA